MAVVDPGVGTERRAIAARIGTAYFVAPDNGLLFPLIEDARAKGLPLAVYALDQPKYWLPTLSASFHGRDIFAPIAAHLANGLPIDRLGTLVDNPAPLQLSQPTPKDNGWLAKVVLVDVFGNLITNLPASVLLEGSQDLSVTIKDQTIHGLTRTFGDAEPGSLITSIDSSGYLTISIVNGSAAAHLDAALGTPLAVATS
jgi:S-adenosylmethionine hydrolase